jgi:ATP/ADP translocase
MILKAIVFWINHQACGTDPRIAAKIAERLPKPRSSFDTGHDSSYLLIYTSWFMLWPATVFRVL